MYGHCSKFLKSKKNKL